MKRNCCDVCGHASNFPMSRDERLKTEFGIDVDICLDCSAYLDDHDRYERLYNNGVIDDEVYEKLMNNEEK